MKGNRIIDELNAVAVAGSYWHPEQKHYYEQLVNDAKPVECVRMRDVFDAEQLFFLKVVNYHAEQKMCYKNAAVLVTLMSQCQFMFPKAALYIEGFNFGIGLFLIEHAFVKYGDKYIDPTFERALKRDVTKEQYASLIELSPTRMSKYQQETGYYGELYRYNYMLNFRPEMAAKIRAMNPHK